MKKFTFYHSAPTVIGGSEKVEILASNQGIAIALFKKQCGAVKILKIEKEKITNGNEEKK